MVKRADDLQRALGRRASGPTRRQSQAADRCATPTGRDLPAPRRDALRERRARCSSVVPWEDWLTFAITTVMFMAVVQLDRQRELGERHAVAVPDRVRGAAARATCSRACGCSSLLLYPVALVHRRVADLLPAAGDHPRRIRCTCARTRMLDRMYAGGRRRRRTASAATRCRSSSCMLVLLGWARSSRRGRSSAGVTRGSAIIPGGIALMWNISFIPGQFSSPFVVFLFGAVLLVMRMHVSHKETEWEQRRHRLPGVHQPLGAQRDVLGDLSRCWLRSGCCRSPTARRRRARAGTSFTSPSRHA